MNDSGKTARKRKIFTFSCSVFLFLSFVTFSYSKEKNLTEQFGTLERIEISKSQKTLEVKIILDHFTRIDHFKLSNPNRIVIDFFETKEFKAPQYISVDDFGIHSIRTGKFRPDTVRVVIDVGERFPLYKTEEIQGGFRILFWSQEAVVVKKEQIIEKIQEEAAISNLKVSPVKANPNDPVLVDMSGSLNAESMEVEVFDPEGTKIRTQKLTPESSRWEIRLENPGDYVFKAKAFNNQSIPSTNICEARVHINFPPICKLKFNYHEVYIGKPFTLDVSDSIDPDGKVVKVHFEIFDEKQNLVDKLTLMRKPYVWKRVFEKEGIYTIPVVITDDFGVESEPAQIQLVASDKKVFYLFDAGPLFARGNPLGGFAVARIGLLYKIVPETLEFILSSGAGQNLVSAPWKPFFTANILFNVYFGSFFVGAGSGITTRIREDRNSDGELIGNIGLNILKKYLTQNSVFIELRAPIRKGRIFSEHYKLMFGLRLLF